MPEPQQLQPDAIKLHSYVSDRSTVAVRFAIALMCALDMHIRVYANVGSSCVDTFFFAGQDVMEQSCWPLLYNIAVHSHLVALKA